MKNVLVGQSGGPTSVINSSVLGALEAALDNPSITRVFGMAHGIKGLLNDDLYDIDKEDRDELALLRYTPSSALGSCRYKLADPDVDDTDYKRILEIFKKYDIRYFFYNGGNDSMDTCNKISRYMQAHDWDCRVMGVPKTIDNDLFGTDHCPGFASAAKYIATSCMEVSKDCRVYDTGTITVVEIMGRHAGWLAGSAALASACGSGPDLIYLPERPFDEAQYLRDVQKLIEEKRGVVVVASEGLKDKDGKPIVEPVFKVGRATYFGDVSAHLANLVIKHLGYKARSEKPGLLGRASIALSSDVDRREAILAGEEAVRAACAGENGKMVGFIRESTSPYRARTTLIDVNDVMLVEKKMPDEYINEAGNGVTQAFLDWCAPLIGEPLGKLISLK